MLTTDIDMWILLHLLIRSASGLICLMKHTLCVCVADDDLMMERTGQTRVSAQFSLMFRCAICHRLLPQSE